MTVIDLTNVPNKPPPSKPPKTPPPPTKPKGKGGALSR